MEKDIQGSCHELLESSLLESVQLPGRAEEELSVLRASDSTKEIK
jgi:hypothetical protein